MEWMPISFHIRQGKNDRAAADRGARFATRPAFHLRAAVVSIFGFTAGSLRDQIMNTLTATILATCMSFAAGGAFAAESVSTDAASEDATSQEASANSATESEAMSDDGMVKGGMKEDAMSHDATTEEDGTKDAEVKQ